jgi:hypothetical protein
MVDKKGKSTKTRKNKKATPKSTVQESPVLDSTEKVKKISVQLSNIFVWGDDLEDPHSAIFNMLQQDPNKLVNLLWPNLLVNVTTIDEEGKVIEAKAVRVKTSAPQA